MVYIFIQQTHLAIYIWIGVKGKKEMVYVFEQQFALSHRVPIYAPISSENIL